MKFMFLCRLFVTHCMFLPCRYCTWNPIYFQFFCQTLWRKSFFWLYANNENKITTKLYIHELTQPEIWILDYKTYTLLLFPPSIPILIVLVILFLNKIILKKKISYRIAPIHDRLDIYPVLLPTHCLGVYFFVNLIPVMYQSNNDQKLSEDY